MSHSGTGLMTAGGVEFELDSINPQGYTSISQFVSDSCRRFGDRPAFTCLGRSLSFAELDRLSYQFACYLDSLGLVPGDRIAVQLPNLIQYPVVVFGALRAGLVVVNTNPLYTVPEMSHQFSDAGIKALVFYAGCGERVAKVVEQVPIEHLIVTELADLHPQPKRWLLNTVVKRLKKMVPDFNLPTAVSLNKALARGKGGSLPVHHAKLDDLAVLQYTGGTTGVAKGAMLSHGNLLANFLQLKQHFGDLLVDEQELFIAPLPLYHIYAFTLHCMLLFGGGNHSVLIPNPRDIPGFVKELKKWPFTGFAGLNTLFVALCNDPDFAGVDTSALKFTASGGMALTMDAAERWQQQTGCQVLEGYGLTETSPGVCFNLPQTVQMGTIGCALPLTELKVVDDQGSPMPEDSAGELCVRGPQVMQGYWQRAEATAEVVDGQGWFRTGDVAQIQPDGFVRIVDRKKDVIIVSGFNVYPNELEDVVCSMPQVRECAAIGVPDADTGEQVKLYVVSEDESLSLESVQHYCRERLAAYKLPRQIEFCEELPKTPVGKVLRRALRSD